MKRTPAMLDINSLPQALQSYCHEAKVFDSSCSTSAQTLYLQGELRAFLKIAPAGSLAREKLMTDFLHSHGLAPRVLEYISDGARDYLLTLALEGEDGIAEPYLGDPKRLARVFGESLRQIHQIPFRNCPIQGRMAELISESEANICSAYKDEQIISEDISLASRAFESLKHIETDEVVLHGDYCLPNIIMSDFRLSGFVDLGTGGVGDRHYDLLWGIWTLRYNLKTDSYKDIFLDAYGRSHLDPQRLELCRLLAGFTR